MSDTDLESGLKDGVNRGHRRSRKVISYNEDEDEDDEMYSTRKNRQNGKKKLYQFEESFDMKTEKDDGGLANGGQEAKDSDEFSLTADEEEEDEEEDIKPRKRSRRLRRRNDSEDEDFQDSLSEDEDEFVENLREKNFIASDDDFSEDFGYKKRRRNPYTKRRTRYSRRESNRSRGLKNDDVDSSIIESEKDSIQKEIDDLYDSSPGNTPVKHKLRERDQTINYKIPPPIANDTNVELMNIPSPQSRPRGRKAATKNEFRKLLFPTAGPFGGSDVISLFGKNIPPGGIVIPDTTNGNLTAIGQNVSSSDSSDDEISPVNGEATISKKQPKKESFTMGKLNMNGSPEKKDKKKNTLSDTDPLGVDMNINFSDVGGLDEYIDQLKEMVSLPLLYPELYQNFAITPPRGVLFHGPPGTGKTLVARALAASCSTGTKKITFFMRKGADCLSKWVGEAERQLRLLFEEAKNQQPSIIFFDEIDGLAPVRSSKQEQIHASIVSTLLALMDGMDNRGQVIVIGATNRPDSIDPALRRPGRFDREFYFPLPNYTSRLEILKIHTKAWVPQLSEYFLNHVANLTKGYGGADLRALCTEAALNAIQRKYPQIYQTSEKLKVEPKKVKVTAADFMNAIENIKPSSFRSRFSSSAELPETLAPLLANALKQVTLKLEELIPSVNSTKQKKTKLQEAFYVDPCAKDADGGFKRKEFIKVLDRLRVCKPRFLIHGNQGSGQQYLCSAILNFLEGFHVQSLDIGGLFGDSTKAPESIIVQAFMEARRRQPSVILVPDVEMWESVVPASAKVTLSSLLQSLRSNEQILLLGVSEVPLENLDPFFIRLFDLASSNNYFLKGPSRNQIVHYFSTLRRALELKPYDYVTDIENRPKRKLRSLEVIKEDDSDTKKLSDRKEQKKIEYEDTKLKNILKIKLAGLMDLFKNRYKRFKKPIIDDSLLYHLFDPSVTENPLINYEVLYVRSDDANKDNMIKEIATGKYYYNMDLDIIEERLWNGYYSEPKQFLKDLKMIVKDSRTSGDRERILKANEMFTNAQFGIDEFTTPEFLNSCKEMRKREINRQVKLLEEHEKSLNGTIEEGNQINAPTGTSDFTVSSTIQNVNLDSPSISQKGSGDEPGIDKADKSTVSQELPIAVLPDKIKCTQPAENAIEINEELSESEEENDVLHHKLDQKLILAEGIEEFFEETLPNIAEKFNIEQLELLMARLMEIVWEDRKKWDRTETLQKLIDCSSSIK